MKNEVYDKSIILIGPVGVGKSLVSYKLAHKTNLPIISTDLLRHCPKDIKEIDKKIESLKKNIKEVNNNEKLINELKNDLWVCCMQKEMRELLPDVLNYEEMGFNDEVSSFLEKKFGIIAWHFYQKQFENQLLISLIENLKCPCIIDMGGGMSVCLTSKYKKLGEKFEKINKEIYLNNFKLDKINFSIIKNALKPFKNIIELQLPDDYENMDKAYNDPLNNLFIESKQYGEIATHCIKTNNLIDGDTYNQDVLNNIIDDITKKIVVKKR